MAASTTAVERHLVTVDGTQVEYLVAGAGPDVLLLHGIGESADDWRPLMTRLAPWYRLSAVTLPGFGGLRRTGVAARNPAREGGGDPSPDGFARFVRAFIMAKELDRPVLGGHSLGGLIALRTALDQPVDLRGLVLIAAAGLGHEVTPVLRAATLPIVGDVAAEMARYRPGAMLRAASKAPMVFGRPWRVPQAWLADQYRRALDGQFLAATLRSLRAQVGVWGQRRVVRDELSALSLPTLVLWGTSDRVVPLAHGRAAVARMPAGRLRVLDGLGHLPQVEDPDRVAMELRGFLDALR